VQGLGFVMFAGILSLSGYASIAARRTLSAAPVFLAPIGMVSITSAIGFGTVRFRYAADVALIVTGAVGLAALSTRALRSS
jgi:hypothetical protein